MTKLYGEALKDGEPVIISQIAQLCVDYNIIEPKQAAMDLEAAAGAKPDAFPQAIRVALDFAGMLYRRAGDQQSEQRCQLGAVRQMLRMRDEYRQAGAKASWVMDALLRLRVIKCEEAVALENELENELRRPQRASLRDMGVFAVNIEVPGERNRIIEMFAEMDFSTALKSFALLSRSPNMEDLKAEALRHAQPAPLRVMMGINGHFGFELGIAPLQVVTHPVRFDLMRGEDLAHRSQIQRASERPFLLRRDREFESTSPAARWYGAGDEEMAPSSLWLTDGVP